MPKTDDGIPAPDQSLLRESTYKRPFDLFVLIISHLILSPIWLLLWTVIPIAIWLNDRGPIFYRQERLGKNGKRFIVLKFRSMAPDAETPTGAVWATDNDPRVTRIGRILRNRALDELPQVLNMWKGDMSLVGPRAERPELAEQFAKELHDFPLRLAVRPGLTGLAQTYGRYNTSPRNKLRYDLLYIRRASLWLDLKLLSMSVVLTVKGRWESRSTSR